MVDQRRAVVTGSAGGIGSAVREVLERDGVAVTGVNLRDAEIEADLTDPLARARSGRRATLSADAGWIHGAVLPVDGGTDALVHLDRP